MIEASDFVLSARSYGFDFWTGVPCSFLTPFINFVIDRSDVSYFGAPGEGEAIAIAAGAHLSGHKTVVMCQNSGLGNTVNPLTSLNYTFRIPTLLIVTHRGAPDLKDEPQHELMGQITTDLLSIMRIPWEIFPNESAKVQSALTRAINYMEAQELPYALIMPKGTVAPYHPQSVSRNVQMRAVEPRGQFRRGGSARMTRAEAIRLIRDSLEGSEALVASTGHIGRELFGLGHRANQIYLVGSMGCASALGLGVHEGTQNRRVVVLDGDGAALMKMGILGTVGHYSPAGLVHIILDNEVHGSTGGQATVSSSMDFSVLGSGCGYRHAWRVDDAEELSQIMHSTLDSTGPSLIHVKVGPSFDPNLGRPTLRPVEVKEQFMRWVSS